jgi:predicted GNAT family acetyltransferase
MKTRHYARAADFLNQAQKSLAKDEARYGLIMGIAKILAENENRYGGEAPWYCMVDAPTKLMGIIKPELYAAALRTPPHGVVLAYLSGSLDLVADALQVAVSSKYKGIPGVVGDKELTDTFAERWCTSHGVKVVNTTAQCIYKLVKVNDVQLSPGKLRIATEADKELVKKWGHGFHVDIGGEASRAPEMDIAAVIGRGWVFLWELNGQPVSMALKTRPTDKGMTVSGVYTPPELRGKGYATSCVAELSRHVLQSGYQFCTLYTDLANPTSNSIYMKIGYVEAGDSVEHTFGKPEELTT